nr:unnamed protein product [Digitaria exilis]
MDVLHEVLLRVPAKELCRLRLICRSWRSLTSDPHFARAHSACHPIELEEVHIIDMYSGSIVKRIRDIGDLCKHMSTQAGLVCVSTRTSDVDEQDIVINISGH